MKWSKILDKKINLRYFFLLSICFIVMNVIFGSVLRNQLLAGIPKYGKLGKIAKTIAEFPGLIKESFKTILGNNNSGIIERKVKTGNGFTYFNKNFIDSGFILESVYDKEYKQSIIKLVSVKDGEIAYKWIPPLRSLHLSNKSLAVHPYLSKEGSIVFAIGGNDIAHGYLVKIDSASKLIWSINILPHHSVELDADGNIWIPTLIRKPNFIDKIANTEINDEAITKISPEGKVLLQKSIAQILLENGYKTLLVGVGKVDKDLIHVNEIRPALYASPYWEKGDMLISMRHKSTVFLYRSTTNKIIWLQTGPWMNQHCPDFVDSNKISVFGNDVIRRNEGDYLINGYNDIYIYDFSNNTTNIPYSNMMRERKVSTATQGRLKIFGNGDVFIDETENGLIIRANKNGPIWIFENKFDENHVSLTNWSRYLIKNGNCKFCLTENLK
ncbi:hypothetical protein GALL_109300 [mine drainage metagenome]|uniref:Arylsulfotransferase (ASST) n=1 Tax=mine drainage metagenome TaxID=410659 RepID=A0A1J5SF32_9ZZZZ